MENRDLRDEISELEERIEELAESLERSGKIASASKLSIFAGGLWMLATLVGSLELDRLAMILAVTAVIGGIVLFGSTTATAKQTAAAMKAAQASRAELIGELDLQVVEASRRPET